jgi:hypothetical protein
MKQGEYERITYGIIMAAAETLSRLNPQMTFIYVSGAGTDSSERGRIMWARVKGKTENALLRLPFKAAYMFRPGIIEPLHGVRSKTPAYRIGYTLMAQLLPLLRRIFPDFILATEQIGLPCSPSPSVALQSKCCRARTSAQSWLSLNPPHWITHSPAHFTYQQLPFWLCLRAHSGDGASRRR